MPHILIAADKAVYRPLAYSLEQEGFQVSFLDKGQPIAAAMMACGCDIALAEPESPLLLCEFVRRKTDRPLLVVAKPGEDEALTRTAVLEAGADDCIIAPCNMLECKARIKAILRRIEREKKAVVLPRREVLVLHSEKRCLTIGERQVQLTETEATLMEEFLKQEGRALSREEIALRLWGREDENDLRAIDAHIKRLREKVEKDRKRPQHIQSKWGYGYGLHLKRNILSE